MPSYKFEDDSESEQDAVESSKHHTRTEEEDDAEPGPDDTFHFRQSFSSKTRRPQNAFLDMKMNQPVFDSDEEAAEQDEGMEQSYEDDNMHDEQEYYSDEESLEDDEEIEEESLLHDAEGGQIQKRATWLEQIQYTDHAIKRLKAVEARERLQSSKVHWGGRVPEINYTAEDLERDLFGESATSKVKKRTGFDYLQPEALRQGIFDQQTWDAKQTEKESPNPAFRIQWGPKDTLIHQTPAPPGSAEKDAVSFTKLHLSTIERDAAERQAHRLLERQRQTTTFTVDSTGIPIAHPSSTLQFHIFSEATPTYQGQPRPIDEYETSVWRLASILFDDLPSPSSEKLERKRQLSEFFKDLVSRSVWNDTSRARDHVEKIFLNLTGNRISEACNEATKSKDLHLATLIALSENSPREFREDLKLQLEVWRKDGSTADIQLWYRAVYEVLAGEIDASGGTALHQLGVSERLDWRRAFAVRLWFSIPSEGDIKDAVQEYWMACQQDSSIAKPIPWYTAERQNGVYDGLFQLLRLYAGSGVNTTLDDTLNPYNFSSKVTDVRISWHLYVILTQVKNKASFADAYGSKGSAISETGERLTLSYVAQLDNLGLWQWAIFVALHLRRENTRKGTILSLLASRIESLSNQEDEQSTISLLTEEWKIPMEWILEAKALYARALGDHLQCAKNLVLARSLIEAQKTILSHIAPQAVISTRLSDLEDLLSTFISPFPPGWDIGGQIYLDYISLIQDHAGTIERKRKGPGSRRDAVIRLLRALPAMEAGTFEQRVAVSEMARVVANIVVSTPEMNREIGSVMRLPLLEGDALRITRKVAGGMFDQLIAA